MIHSWQYIRLEDLDSPMPSEYRPKHPIIVDIGEQERDWYGHIYMWYDDGANTEYGKLPACWMIP